MRDILRTGCSIARSFCRINGLLLVIAVAATCSLSPIPKAVGADPLVILVGVADDLAQRIHDTIEKYPRVCMEDDFFSAEWLRTTLEFVLLCRAVRLGGLEATYRLVSFPNSARTRVELMKGSVMVMVDFPWGILPRTRICTGATPCYRKGVSSRGYTPGQTARTSWPYGRSTT